MKRIHCAVFFMAAGALMASVASADVKASKEVVVGTWDGKVEIDEDALKADEGFKKIPAEQAGLVLRVIKDMLGKTTMGVTFNADGKATGEIDGPGIAAKDRLKEGAWEIDGATVKVKLTTKDEGKKTAQREMVFTCLDEKTMTMAFPAKDGQELPKGIVFKFTKK